LSTKDFDRNQAEKYLGNISKKIFGRNDPGTFEGDSRRKKFGRNDPREFEGNTTNRETGNNQPDKFKNDGSKKTYENPHGVSDTTPLPKDTTDLKGGKSKPNDKPEDKESQGKRRPVPPKIEDQKPKNPVDPRELPVYPDARFDPMTARPLNFVTGKPYPIDPSSKRPYDPITGNYWPGLFDPETGLPIEIESMTSYKNGFDHFTGLMRNWKGEEQTITRDGNVEDNETGIRLPGKFDPVTKRQIDPTTNQPIKYKRFDTETGKPIDPVTK
jgi:hypothetical protein